MNHYDRELQNYEQIANDASKDYQFRQVKKQPKLIIKINKTKATQFIKRTAAVVCATAILAYGTIQYSEYLRKNDERLEKLACFHSAYSVFCHASNTVQSNEGFSEFVDSYGDELEAYFESIGNDPEKFDANEFANRYYVISDVSQETEQIKR